MGYQNAAATITLTADGQRVWFEPNYVTTPKSVGVYVGTEYVGSWHCQSDAKQALGLIDVPAKAIAARPLEERR